MILNELITNSIKHAFENNQGNQISVLFETKDGKAYTLEYFDNGFWKSNASVRNGFGLELIELLTEQLDGTVERVSSEEGTKYTFHLKM
ncbi:MAG: sensor histidine kinase [Crocinitomicaceae bacterium]